MKVSILADRRLWLTADKSRVVEDGDPAAAFLLAAPGTEIAPDDVKRFELRVEGTKVVLPGAEGEDASGEAGNASDEGAEGGAGDEAGAESQAEEPKEPAKPEAAKQPKSKSSKAKKD